MRIYKGVNNKVGFPTFIITNNNQLGSISSITKK